MNKFKIIIVITITSLALVSCTGEGPEATIEKMQKAACNADLEEFYSYIDKEDFETLIRKYYYDENIKTKQESSNSLAAFIEEVLYLKGNYYGYDPDKYFIEQEWKSFKDDIRNGESSYLCQLEIIGPGEKENSMIVETPFQGELLWIFKKSWGNYKVIKFDTVDEKKEEQNAQEAAKLIRRTGCERDVEGFFSLIDKEAVAKNYKRAMVKKLKNIYSKKYSGWEKLTFYANYYLYISKINESDIEEVLSHRYITNLYEETLWDALEKEIKKGKSGGVCTFEIKAVGDELDDFDIEDTKVTATWKLAKGLTDWKVVAINLDAYIANSIEDNWEDKN